jgi:hypothetical protein
MPRSGSHIIVLSAGAQASPLQCGQVYAALLPTTRSETAHLPASIHSAIHYSHGLSAGGLYTESGCPPVQVADSCLALGAQSCRRARQVLDELCSSGKLGQAAKVSPL